MHSCDTDWSPAAVIWINWKTPTKADSLHCGICKPVKCMITVFVMTKENLIIKASALITSDGPTCVFHCLSGSRCCWSRFWGYCVFEELTQESNLSESNSQKLTDFLPGLHPNYQRSKQKLHTWRNIWKVEVHLPEVCNREITAQWALLCLSWSQSFLVESDTDGSIRVCDSEEPRNTRLNTPGTCTGTDT